VLSSWRPAAILHHFRRFISFQNIQTVWIPIILMALWAGGYARIVGEVWIWSLLCFQCGKNSSFVLDAQFSNFGTYVVGQHFRRSESLLVRSKLFWNYYPAITREVPPILLPVRSQAACRHKSERMVPRHKRIIALKRRSKSLWGVLPFESWSCNMAWLQNDLYHDRSLAASIPNTRLKPLAVCVDKTIGRK